ncbi:hypothetical protein BJ875DRAFT_154868 [Amylocarpus encephaloides]|uniref:Uncharacterized protein n=1 Tax=Amylocarpus encephaloides TaxID=45428 RepID=A0A9P8C216_9HELO|nr:hypothetical protein BJ875DRAFT_154868 [Amylocarpus encephaloides]
MTVKSVPIAQFLPGSFKLLVDPQYPSEQTNRSNKYKRGILHHDEQLLPNPYAAILTWHHLEGNYPYLAPKVTSASTTENPHFSPANGKYLLFTPHTSVKYSLFSRKCSLDVNHFILCRDVWNTRHHLLYVQYVHVPVSRLRYGSDSESRKLIYRREEHSDSKTDLHSCKTGIGNDFFHRVSKLTEFHALIFSRDAQNTLSLDSLPSSGNFPLRLLPANPREQNYPRQQRDTLEIYVYLKK